MTYKEIQLIASEYLMLQDPLILKLLPGIVMANRIPNLTPTWFFLVGASSGGKSTLLEAFETVAGIFYVDDMSANTLFSGMKATGKETSLINEIPQNGTVIMTDFTLMLDKDEIATKQIMSQLRLIYDGKFRSFKGNAQNHDVNPKFGLILGVTSAVFEKQQQYAALGERLSYYVFDQPEDRVAVGMKALKNIGKGEEIKIKLGNAIREWCDGAGLPSMTPFPEELQLNITKLCEMSTKARSSISRKKYSRDNPITSVHFLEMPGRLAKQMLNLAYGLRSLNPSGNLEEEDYLILYKSAIDSIPLERKKVMELLTHDRQGEIGALAAEIGYPYETIKLHLEDLAALGVLKSHKSYKKEIFYYELKSEYRELISKFKHIKMTDNVLDVKPEQAPEEPPLSNIERQQLTAAQLL